MCLPLSASLVACSGPQFGHSIGSQAGGTPISMRSAWAPSRTRYAAWVVRSWGMCERCPKWCRSCRTRMQPALPPPTCRTRDAARPSVSHGPLTSDGPSGYIGYGSCGTTGYRRGDRNGEGVSSSKKPLERLGSGCPGGGAATRRRGRRVADRPRTTMKSYSTCDTTRVDRRSHKTHKKARAKVSHPFVANAVH